MQQVTVMKVMLVMNVDDIKADEINTLNCT